MKTYRKRKKQRGGNYQSLSQINTANKNLIALNQLQHPKPPLQIPGQVVNGLQGHGKRNKHRGGSALVDKYGNYIHAY